MKNNLLSFKNTDNKNWNVRPDIKNYDEEIKAAAKKWSMNSETVKQETSFWLEGYDASLTMSQKLNFDTEEITPQRELGFDYIEGSNRTRWKGDVGIKSSPIGNSKMMDFPITEGNQKHLVLKTDQVTIYYTMGTSSVSLFVIFLEGT